MYEDATWVRVKTTESMQYRALSLQRRSTEKDTITRQPKCSWSAMRDAAAVVVDAEHGVS